jgi:hypothetical protein
LGLGFGLGLGLGFGFGFGFDLLSGHLLSRLKGGLAQVRAVCAAVGVAQAAAAARRLGRHRFVAAILLVRVGGEGEGEG